MFNLEKLTIKPILIGQVGSKAYGTDVEGSDDDYMGIGIDVEDAYLGLKSPKEVCELKVESDFVCYELKKFLHLALNFNPNVIPLLWLRKEDYKLITPSGQLLLDHRDSFLSKRMYNTFVGYAKSQMNKVENSLTGKLGEKRKHLVAKYGFDCKFAYHTIRLLKMGFEALLLGEVQVYREYDRELLLDIRNGNQTLTQFKDLANSLFGAIDIAYTESKLPDEPDYDSVNRLCKLILCRELNLTK